MLRRPTRLGIALYVALALLGLGLFVASPFPRGALLRAFAGIAVAAFVAVWAYGTFAPAAIRRKLPLYEQEFPLAGEARVAPGGEFEWHPRGETRAGVRHGIVHRWWDAERGGRYDAELAFDVPDDVPAALLRKATKRALAAATSALPGRGKVRAEAAARDEPGPTSLVRVRLHVQGVGADPTWARAAAEGFARGFLASLKREGVLADRRDE